MTSWAKSSQHFALANNFLPPAYLHGGHRQTLLARFLPRDIVLNRLHFESFALSDGDVLECVWSGPATGPIALILHGLAGSFASPYVKGMMHVLNQVGFRTVLMHFRGCGQMPNRLDRLYHGGDTGDMAEVVAKLQKREGVDIVAVGFSLGANALLKWLGECGRQCPLRAAVAISVPFDLGASVDHMSSVYDQWLLRGLKRQVRRKFKNRPWPKSLLPYRSARNLRAFDDQVTAPLHGFKDANDYYTQSSSAQYIRSIQTPTMILHAKDDPFVPLSCVPTVLPDQVQLHLTQTGGHVGFVEQIFPSMQFWHERQVARFFTKAGIF